MGHFDPDLSDPLLAAAASLRTALHADAIARDKAGGAPLEQLQRLRDAGLPSAQIPVAYGGQGASWRSVLRAVRELAKTDGSLAQRYGEHHVALHALVARGTAAQRDRLLLASARGQWLWAHATDAGQPLAGARRDGESWVLDGVLPTASGAQAADRLLIEWQDIGGKRFLASLPADREGLVIDHALDSIGQRQSGHAMVRLQGLRVADDEVLGAPDAPSTPFLSLDTLLRQSVQFNVSLGSAQGALREARDYTNTSSRPWIHSGVARHTDDPWVQRKYGELAIRTWAATELAEQAADQLDAAYAQGADLGETQRDEAAASIAAANLYAGETALAVSSEIFEVMGARSATTANGFDRFWRNTRTQTLQDRAEHRQQALGRWLLGEGHDCAPALFEPDTRNPFVARAVELRALFAQDAIERDQAGGRPAEQIRLLKQHRLLALLLPREHGGEGEPWSTTLRITRTFAQVDGSLGHLYGYHGSSLLSPRLRQEPEKARDLWRRSTESNWFWGNTANSFSKSLFGRREGEWFVLDGFRPFTSGSHVADFLAIAWEDPENGDRRFAAIPADREGLVIENDWDGIGQRQTGSGRVTYRGVRVHESEVLGAPAPLNPTGAPVEPYRTLTPLQQQSVLLNVFVGTAQGALRAAREHTRQHAGVAYPADDPGIQRQYGALYAKTLAATALADRALRALDDAVAQGEALTATQRGEAAVAIAAANVLAGEVALEVTSEIFEVLGADAATRSLGLDRFWRNARIHTLHNPAEYKTRNVGRWFVSDQPPEPGTFQ
jgi:alkylation response protein AidB-like acyl-CoA dehydrogenase